MRARVRGTWATHLPRDQNTTSKLFLFHLAGRSLSCPVSTAFWYQIVKIPAGLSSGNLGALTKQKRKKRSPAISGNSLDPPHLPEIKEDC